MILVRAKNLLAHSKQYPDYRRKGSLSTTENLPQPPVERVCPKCGAVLKREWRACPDCGWTMTRHGIPHGSAIASIACSAVGFFFLGVFFGLVGAGLGASAVMRKDKDKLGYIGIILGIAVFILSTISMILQYSIFNYF
jgi:hypothetical protein